MAPWSRVERSPRTIWYQFHNRDRLGYERLNKES
jgi:hypothetical protein